MKKKLSTERISIKHAFEWKENVRATQKCAFGMEVF